MITNREIINKFWRLPDSMQSKIINDLELIGEYHAKCSPKIRGVIAFWNAEKHEKEFELTKAIENAREIIEV